MEVAGVRFARSDNPETVEIISRLQRAGLSVFLASERMCAKQHSIDRYSGNMSAGDKIAFLRDLRRESINAAYVGDCMTNASMAREAYLSIGFAMRDAATGAEWERGPRILLCLHRRSLRCRHFARWRRTPSDDASARGTQSRSPICFA
jgi:hypothetical protein